MKRIHIVLFSLAIYSCAPTQPGSGRKKMPEFTSDYSLEGPPAFQPAAQEERGSTSFFEVYDAGENMPGVPAGYLYIPLPDPSLDSMAIAILHSYQGAAGPLFRSYASAYRRGVAIDLCGHQTTDIYRAAYTLRQGDLSIPVILLWDRASAGRVATLKNLVAQIPAVSLLSDNK